MGRARAPTPGPLTGVNGMQATLHQSGMTELYETDVQPGLLCPPGAGGRVTVIRSAGILTPTPGEVAYLLCPASLIRGLCPEIDRFLAPQDPRLAERHLDELRAADAPHLFEASAA